MAINPIIVTAFIVRYLSDATISAIVVMRLTKLHTLMFRCSIFEFRGSGVGVRCSMLGARCSTFTFNYGYDLSVRPQLQPPMFELRCQPLMFRCSIFEFRGSGVGVRCSMLGARCSTFTFNYGYDLSVRPQLQSPMFELRCQPLMFRCSIFEFRGSGVGVRCSMLGASTWTTSSLLDSCLRD